MCRTKYESKNRSALDYHQERFKSLRESTPLALADRVACYLLAMVWSSGRGSAGGLPHESYDPKGKGTYSAVRDQKAREKTVPPVVPDPQDKGATKAYAQSNNVKTQYHKIPAPSFVNLKDAEKTDKVFLDTMARDHSNLRQFDIDLECTAAAFVNDKWYFAANTVEILAEDVLALQRDMWTFQYEIVPTHDLNMHAEMKILKWLRFKRPTLLARNHDIGVSKPCCPSCKEILDAWGINYTSYHNDRPKAGRWVDPNLGAPEA